jgi:hypothetical protein
MTKGWIESGTHLDEQHEIMARKQGENQAGILFKKMLQGYKLLVFIDTGNYELERYWSPGQKMAQRLNLRYEEIKGENSLVKKAIERNLGWRIRHCPARTHD